MVFPRRGDRSAKCITRKALQAAGMTFRVSDIPRDLRGGC
ncbi:hypothetical protein ACUOA5_39480, partial [Escherichia coli]